MNSGNESAAADSSRGGFPPPGQRGWARAGLAALLALGIVALAGAQKGPATPATSKGTSRVPARQPSDAELIRRRAAWFHDQRAFPLGFIPAGARLRALEQLRQMKAAQQQMRQFQTFGTAAAGDPPWTPFGPQPSTSPDFAPFVSGRVTALAVNPASPSNVYLGAALGGVWKTTDAGATWTPLTDSQPSLAVGSLAVDSSTCTAGPPPTCQTIYVGTGEENFAIDSYYGAGVLKSTDGGMTWTQDSTFKALIPISTTSGGPRIGALAIDPKNNQILLAAVQGFQSTLQSGIWCSANAGVSWMQVLPSVTGVPGTDVVFGADGTAYAGLSTIDSTSPNTSVSGIYRSASPVSTACPTSWTQLTLPVSNSSIGRVALGIGPSTSQPTTTLFAAIASAASGSVDLLGVFKTTNGGAMWTQPSTSALVQPGTGLCSGQCFYDLVIRVDPGNANVVFAGGSAVAFGGNATLIRSADGGASWTEVSGQPSPSGIHVDMHAIAFSSSGGTLYVGNDGGVWSTANPTASPISWTNLNGTLGTLQFYPGLSVHPSNPAFRSFGGTQDNGLERYSGGIPSDLLQWDDTGTLGDGGFTIIDPNFPSTVYAASEFFPGSVLFLAKSLQNGDGIGSASSFFVLNDTARIINDPKGNFIPPFVIDPSNSQNLYFGTFRVWQSTDGGNTFSAISLDLSGPGAGCSAQSGSQCLSAIAVALANPSMVYVGSGLGHVNVTANAGAGPGNVTWSDVSTGLPTRAVTQIAVDPLNAQAAYVTFSGFSSCSLCDHLGHVFQTTTGGTAWVDITGNLPDIPVNDIVVDPDVSGTLYIATDIGVFQTSAINGSLTTWSQLGTALPTVAVLSLKLDRAARQLFAATHGRSVWEQQLSFPTGVTFDLATINPASASAGGASFTLTVTGNGFTGSSVVKWTIGTNTFTLTPQLSGGSMTQFSVTVPPAVIAGGGVAQVAVFDAVQPAPSTTNSLLFTVLNPAPTVTSISTVPAQPLTAPVQQNVTLTVNGTNFNASSTVQLDQTGPASLGLTGASVNSSGTQLTVTIPQSALQFGGEFVVVVTNPQPGGGSSDSPNNLSCPLPDPLACPAAVLTARGPVPANDPITAATIVGASPFTGTEDNSGATVDTGGTIDPLPPCVAGQGAANNGAANSVWFKATAGANATTIEADTIGSAYDTILSVWSGTLGNLVNVACNDDIVLGVNRVSQVFFSATPGTTYFFMVSSFEGDGGKTVFNLSGNVVLAPNYTAGASPTSATVKAGQTTSPITITLTPQAGSPSGAVALVCPGLPLRASCNFSPNPSNSCTFMPPNMVNLNASCQAVITLTISTMASSNLFPLPLTPATRLPVYAPWLSLAAMALLFSLWLGRRSARIGFVFGFACAFLLLAMLVFQVSCGGGSSPTHVPGTPPGTYTVTVNGNPASSGGQVPPTVTLTVTP